MFGRLMNNYYYGKSGKGDFRKEDMPDNRWQLFLDTLRTRLSGLCRLNLLYMIVFLPTIIVIGFFYTQTLQRMTYVMAAQDGTLKELIASQTEEGKEPVAISDEEIANIASLNMGELLESGLYRMLLWLIPCLAITGPFTSGLCYVTRNWARDEHAFIWSDFKDAVRANWKPALLLSFITALLPFVVFLGWRFYGQMAQENTIMILPQVLLGLIAAIWALSITYMHPMVVSYELKFTGIVRNGVLLGVARLPFSIGIRLLHCVPAIIGGLIAFFWHPIYGMLILGAYYILIGFGLSRFVTASYTNAVFDKYINSRIEGAEINRGLRKPEDDDDEEDEDEAAETDGEKQNQPETEG